MDLKELLQSIHLCLSDSRWLPVLREISTTYFTGSGQTVEDLDRIMGPQEITTEYYNRAKDLCISRSIKLSFQGILPTYLQLRVPDH